MKPDNVRIARQDDAEQLFALIRESEREWKLGNRNYDKVRAVIGLAVDRSPLFDADGDPVLRPTFGVVEGDLGIEGTCGIYPMQQWDSDELYLKGFVLYVHADRRRTTHAKSLLQFGNWLADRTGLPMIWELYHPEGTEAKARLYARQATSVGGLFIHQPVSEAIAA